MTIKFQRHFLNKTLKQFVSFIDRWILTRPYSILFCRELIGRNMVAIRFDNLISNTLLAATGGSKTNVFRLGATGRGMVHDKEYYKEEYRKFRLKKSRSIFGMKKPINLIDGVKPMEKSRKLSSLRPGSNLNAGSQHESKSKWNREKETKTSRRRGRRRRRRRMNEWEKEREKERGMGRRWRWCNPFEWFNVWWEPRNWAQFSFLVFYYIFDYQSRCFFSFLLLFFSDVLVVSWVEDVVTPSFSFHHFFGWVIFFSSLVLLVFALFFSLFFLFFSFIWFFISLVGASMASCRRYDGTIFVHAAL